MMVTMASRHAAGSMLQGSLNLTYITTNAWPCSSQCWLKTESASTVDHPESVFITCPHGSLPGNLFCAMARFEPRTRLQTRSHRFLASIELTTIHLGSPRAKSAIMMANLCILSGLMTCQIVFCPFPGPMAGRACTMGYMWSTGFLCCCL
jgi:hypothetical protein